MKKKDIIAQILAYTFATMFFVILYYDPFQFGSMTTAVIKDGRNDR